MRAHPRPVWHGLALAALAVLLSLYIYAALPGISRILLRAQHDVAGGVYVQIERVGWCRFAYLRGEMQPMCYRYQTQNPVLPPSYYQAQTP